MAPFVAQVVRLQKYEVLFHNAKQTDRTENLVMLHRYKAVTQLASSNSPACHTFRKEYRLYERLLSTALHV
jgi:hypothetical protein